MHAAEVPERSFMAPTSASSIVVRLRLIGRMHAWTVAGESILPPGRVTRALLAAIALSAPRPAPRGWLTNLLSARWRNEHAHAPLRPEVRRLAEALAPAGKGLLVATRDALSLRPGAVWTDVGEIMLATAECPGALGWLDGELLADLGEINPAFDSWLRGEREQLHDHAREVAEASWLAQTEPEATIVALRRLLFIDPVHEAGWRALIRAYADRGDRAMAIGAYEQCRAALAARLDAAPSDETRELLVEIGGTVAAARNEPPPRRVSEPEFIVTLPQPAVGGTSLASDHMPRTGPNVGVLPLRRIGPIEDSAQLGPSFAHEITAALSRFHRVIVTPADALARFARDNGDEAAIRREFGIDYLLHGTIQREQRRLRVSLRLLDLRADNQIVWAERFDRIAADLNAARDAIVAETVARVEPEMQMMEASRVPSRPLAELSANELLLLTAAPITRMERDGFMRAGEYLERAITIEPNFCDVHGWYAFWHVLLVSQGWASDPRRALIRGVELADRAVALDPLAVRALTIAGLLRSQLSRPRKEVEAFYDRAVEVNPNLAMTWALSAIHCANVGNIGEAERRFDVYKALSPLHRLAFVFDAFFAPIHLIKRNYQAAIATGHAVMQLNPGFSAGYKPHLAALGHLGHHQEAASVLRRLLAVEPDFTIRRFLDTSSIRHQADREHFVEGLRLAGVR